MVITIVVIFVFIVLLVIISLIFHYYLYEKLYKVDAVVKEAYVTGIGWSFDDEAYTMATGIKVYGRRIYHIIVNTEFGEREWNYVEYKKETDSCDVVHWSKQKIGDKLSLLVSRRGKKAYTLEQWGD